MLEPIANQALRLFLGAYRTSTVSSLQVLGHETPLELLWEQLSFQCCTKLKSNTLNPTHKTNECHLYTEINLMLYHLLVYAYKLVYML